MVVQLIHNDFDETYRFLKTRYASSFLKIGMSEAGRPFEIVPVDFEGGSSDVLRNSNTFRYLYYKTGAYLQLKNLVSRLWWGGDEEFKPEFISSAVDIRRIGDHAKNRFFARYVLSEMKALAREDGFKLAFAMDGVREAVSGQAARELRGAQAQCHRAGPDVRVSTCPSSTCRRPLPTTTVARAIASSSPSIGTGTRSATSWRARRSRSSFWAIGACLARVLPPAPPHPCPRGRADPIACVRPRGRCPASIGRRCARR